MIFYVAYNLKSLRLNLPNLMQYFWRMIFETQTILRYSQIYGLSIIFLLQFWLIVLFSIENKLTVFWFFFNNAGWSVQKLNLLFSVASIISWNNVVYLIN